ncbi:MAG: penicillin-binding protein family [Gemmatimonadetes bacterium]|nr:penicillin-binding protein family [Gemmatimonadota bacterium]
MTLPPALARRVHILRQRWSDRSEPPSRWIRRQWPGIAALAVAITALFAFDAWLATCGFAGCPTRAEVRAFHPSEGGRILDRQGRLIGHLAIVRRVNVPLASVPAFVRNAFIATEDRRFYDHNGLDWRGFIRATTRNVAHMGVREGFSTITMQVARNSFLQSRYHGRSFRRKLVELRLTRVLESELTKDQILELYLNVIYLGNGMNGIEAASRDLFGKSVEKLTLSEAALLAGLPKAPSSYTPRRSPARAEKRRNLVLGLMTEQGYITAGEAAGATRQPLRIAEEEWRPSTNELSAIDAVRAVVDSVLPDALKEGEVTVQTTLDLGLQRAADRAVARQAAVIEGESGGREPVQGALVALDPATGDLRALVPGRRTQRGGFNRAFSARRQPGSAFKPFVYAAAIAAGMSPATEVDDTPVDVDIGGSTWSPSNYGDQYAGRITFRSALAHSSNAATVRVSRNVGEERVIAAARRNGITSALSPVPAIALGALEVTPLELVTAYAPFANGGTRVRPRLVERIQAPDGTVLWSIETQAAPAMDPRDAYEITGMLRAVVDHGTGRVIRDMGLTGPIAGKTGTTNNGADVWFVGYTPSLVAGVWFGYDTPRQLGNDASGGRLAAPAWAEAYRNGWHEKAGATWVVPPGMVSAIIDSQTGYLANEWCPVKRREWFKPGSEPTISCPIHSENPMDMGDSTGINLPDVTAPIRKAGKGLGKLFRRIFHF